MSKQPNILVLGATGTVGSQVVQQLVDAGDRSNFTLNFQTHKTLLITLSHHSRRSCNPVFPPWKLHYIQAQPNVLSIKLSLYRVIESI
ncbi:MAG: hypothetical protein QNJ34_27750 [Xenococcaceae cyanobacterium MO_188.B29]|nr:hypothetical protein [Xenococcaceae cyanobacterium MO_188.B29]